MAGERGFAPLPSRALGAGAGSLAYRADRVIDPVVPLSSNPIRPPRKAPGPLTLATPLPTALAAPGGMAGVHASAGNGKRCVPCRVS